MRLYILTIIIVLFLVPAGSQAQYTRQVVQLRNKAFTTGTIANPSTYLTARAIQRRTRYGIAIDSTDLPLSSRYLDSIRSVSNVQIISVSRWLNQALIRTSDASALTRINAFPFVQSTAPQGLRTTGNTVPQRNKFPETVSPIDPSIIGRTQGTIGLDTFNYGNNYAQIHIHEGEFLHNKNFTGQGMVIAVLDGGFQNYRTITAFDSVRLQGRILGEKDFVAFDNSVNEDHPHGMQCLSTICANWPGRMVGTAPSSSFWLIRTEDVATEYPVEEFNWIVGAEFADSVGVDLISSSLGYTTFDAAQFNHTYDQLNGNTIPVTKTADYAAHKGIIVTNSAGNDGNAAWRYIGVPADGDSVVAVGAVNSAGTIAAFSSLGYPADPRIKPNVVSVGQNTVIAGTTGPVTGSGTSYSNPNLNGLIACLWQAFPERNNQQIINAVYQSSDRYSAPDRTYGNGIPNFRKAYYILKKVRNDSTFGVEWLKATPNPFSDTVRATFVAQKSGTIAITLIRPDGSFVATKTITGVEEQEIYSVRFDTLTNQLGGFYTVRYSDSANTRQIQIVKNSGWLRATPNPFTDTIRASFVAQLGGTITVALVNPVGTVVATKTITAVQWNTYAIRFDTLSTLSSGVYTVRYSDGTNTLTTQVIKNGTVTPPPTNIDFSADWFKVYPIPYRSNFTVAVKSPVSGTATIKIVDANGRLLASFTKQVSQNEVYTHQFALGTVLSSGAYFVQYTDVTNERVKKIVKQ